MITRERFADGGSIVTFHAPVELDGLIACVVGDFNEWDPTANPFSPGGPGTAEVRVATVRLPPGRYRFRYLTASGHWFNDPAADDYEPNEYGGSDGVLNLPAAAPDFEAPAGSEDRQ